MVLMVNLDVFKGTILFLHDSISVSHGDGINSILSTFYHSYRFACQQSVLETFPGSEYLRSKNGVVWLWHLLVSLHIYIYMAHYFALLRLNLCALWQLRESGLSSLCHSCEFACQQRILKTFLDLRHLRSGWSSLTTAHISKCAYISLTIASGYGSVPVPYLDSGG